MAMKLFTADQRDALQEVVNIAMGQAGDSLARVLDTFVHLSIPQIRVITSSEVGKAVLETVGQNYEVTAVRQAFYDSLRGEAIALFALHGCKDLADLMGYEGELSDIAEQELLLDVANILVGAILNGITETLGLQLSFSAPSIMAERTCLDEIISPENLTWSYALLLEVNFSLEDRDFKSHVLLLMAEGAIDSLHEKITIFMDSV